MDEATKTDEEQTNNVTALRARDGLAAGEALESKDAYTKESWWRWEAMIKGGAVAKTETPATCIAKAAYGAVFGWSPVVAVNRIYFVEGRPCLSAEAMLGLIRERFPAAKIYKTEHTKAHVTIKAKRDAADEEWHVVDLDIADFGHLSNKTNWKNYPKAMLWARAVSMLARELFSDVMLGVYTPDEVDAEFTVRQEPKNRTSRAEHVAPPSMSDDSDADDQRPIVEPEDEAPVLSPVADEPVLCGLCGRMEDDHEEGCPESPDGNGAA